VVIAHSAVIRGRLMELLAGYLLSRDECDQAFVVGIFSLLEPMTGVPLADGLRDMALPSVVEDALVSHSGPFAPFLDLTLACESGDETAFAAAADRLHLSSHQVNMAHLQALAWAEELLA